MNDFSAYLFVTIGVVVAVILPVLTALVRKEFPPEPQKAIAPWLKRYLILGVFSLVVAVVALAIWRESHPTDRLHWFTAFLIGFGWESAIEKFLHPAADLKLARA